ncbi:hypothetical protein K1T71_001495 [Dendrolimus kikuchii]|uniref:Uncharacterized protein n=1 Tax=Dendrolimus kikuchii TaxID=765133 RepID=A0ACC1DIE6_9NEOP|nr:hypothetical protein K1T71_001495 [Dendrolimus kikuchii]
MTSRTKLLRGLSIESAAIGLTNFDAQKCRSIANLVIIQCIAVYIGSITILHCVWNPYHATLDYDKLARIMYLYDSQACETRHNVKAAVVNLHLSNDTRGLDVLPIKWAPAIITVSTRLSAKTRTYIEASIAVHVSWMLSAIFMLIFIRSSRHDNILKIVLAIFFYITIFIIIFDVSMGIVYIAHIQQSLTKGMIIRYSGWSVDMKVSNYEDFAGWLPIMASVCWMRGVFILVLNVIMCKVIYHIRKKIRIKEFRQKMMRTKNLPVPEAKFTQPSNRNVLHFRTGEFKPYVKKDFSHKFF